MDDLHYFCRHAVLLTEPHKCAAKLPDDECKAISSHWNITGSRIPVIRETLCGDWEWVLQRLMPPLGCHLNRSTQHMHWIVLLAFRTPAFFLAVRLTDAPLCLDEPASEPISQSPWGSTVSAGRLCSHWTHVATGFADRKSTHRYWLPM